MKKELFEKLSQLNRIEYYIEEKRTDMELPLILSWMIFVPLLVIGLFFREIFIIEIGYITLIFLTIFLFILKLIFDFKRNKKYEQRLE